MPLNIYNNIDSPMHHTKRQKSPTRHKPVNIARPLLINKQVTTQSVSKPISVGISNTKSNIATIPNAVPIKIQTSPTTDTVKQEVPKFIPPEFIKQYAIRNTYDICMIKKFIGKKILIPAKGLLLTPKIREDAKNIKSALLLPADSHSKLPKNIIMHVVCIQGTMSVINGYSNYLAISSISYKDIETNSSLKNTEIKLVQLPKVSNIELRMLLDYFT